MTERRYQRYFYKRRSLKACIHKLRVPVLNLMLEQMNTNFRRFKLIVWRTMAGDALKDNVNDATPFLDDFNDVLHVCRFVGRKPAFCRTLISSK